MRSYCLLNELKHFYIIENISVDILHDVYEGAMPLLMYNIFTFMIKQKLVKKDKIIQMVKSHNYGHLDRRNIPSTVKLEKSNLGQNGSQARCLFENLPFIFAAFRENIYIKRIWNSFESLSRVSQIIHSTEISSISLDELDDNVFVLLNSIQTNFKIKLTPKLHNLTHYSRIIPVYGSSNTYEHHTI